MPFCSNKVSRLLSRNTSLLSLHGCCLLTQNVLTPLRPEQICLHVISTTQRFSDYLVPASTTHSSHKVYRSIPPIQPSHFSLLWSHTTFYLGRYKDSHHFQSAGISGIKESSPCRGGCPQGPPPGTALLWKECGDSDADR